jgi:hypothetical protein
MVVGTTARTAEPPNWCAALGIGSSHPFPVETDLVVHLYEPVSTVDHASVKVL